MRGIYDAAHQCFTVLPGILRRHSLSMETAIFSAASSHFASFNQDLGYPLGRMTQKNSNLLLGIRGT